MDDPTANLDVLERERVTELLRALAEEEGVAVLMAVPDLPAAMRAHEVLSLGAGRLARASEPPQPPLEETEPEPGKVIHLHGRQSAV